MDNILDFTTALSSNTGGLLDDLVGFIKALFGAGTDLAGSSSKVDEPTTVPLTPLVPATPIVDVDVEV